MKKVEIELNVRIWTQNMQLFMSKINNTHWNLRTCQNTEMKHTIWTNTIQIIHIHCDQGIQNCLSNHGIENTTTGNKHIMLPENHCR